MNNDGGASVFEKACCCDVAVRGAMVCENGQFERRCCTFEGSGPEPL
jgi:hypothetical protein